MMWAMFMGIGDTNTELKKASDRFRVNNKFWSKQVDALVFPLQSLNLGAELTI